MVLEEPSCAAIAGSQVLILACGNPLRRDDGAGLLLAEQLAAFLATVGQSHRLVTVQQFTPELALAIADEALSSVIFVDTRAWYATDSSPFQIEIQPLAGTLPGPTLGHHLGPETLLLYARELYGYAPAAWLLTVPGVDFDHGTALSPQVSALLAESGVARYLFPPAHPL